ncbi:MAG: universal stress protein [Chromatiales bacterium]|nr:universal stress protein [Chromatiales bacterium]MDH3931517.1 universal stress protein [Chromatiales bacterium]MDH4012555.1 universal stress protein [Chromatiales bacterium]
MSRISKILVVADPTATEQPAVSRALDIARILGARLEVFACVYDQYISGEHFFDSRGLEKSRASMVRHTIAALQEMVASLNSEGLDISYAARWDSPLDEGIVRQCLHTQADMLIKDTHHHPPLKRSLFSNTDWNLIRTCPCPVLLVKPSTSYPYAHIAAAVDPTHEHDKPAALDNAIIAVAEELARETGAEFHIAHTFLPVSAAVCASAVPGAVIYPIDISEEVIEQAHREALTNLLAQSPRPPDHVHMVAGRTSDVLQDLVAEKDIDLLVMGAVARNRLKRIFLGSTAERVLEHLSCDVLVVKPPEFETPVQREGAQEEMIEVTAAH